MALESPKCHLHLTTRPDLQFHCSLPSKKFQKEQKKCAFSLSQCVPSEFAWKSITADFTQWQLTLNYADSRCL